METSETVAARMTAADALVEQLNAAGERWRDTLPDGARIVCEGHPSWWDTVEAAPGVQAYRREVDADGAGPYWVRLGWSDASKAGRAWWRPSPYDLHDVPDVD